MKIHRREFLKQAGFGIAGLGLLSSMPGCFSSHGATRGRLPRSAPEAQGVSSEGILAFLDAAAKSKHEFHSIMMVCNGCVVAEGWWTPYRSSANHMLYSLSKSFTSTAAGFAVSEGKLKVDDFVTSFFPDDLPEHVSDHLAALHVKHLLTMSVGHEKDSTPIITKEQNWAKAFLALPIENPPGTHFLYNSGATYMTSAIVQKVTRQKVIDYLRPRLFEPLKIQGMTWETCPRGINTGGWGLSVRTESLAKFGQFYLQRGAWDAQQLLPTAWVEEATTFKIQQPAGKGGDLNKLKMTSDWHQGYCYQFWRCRHNAFRGDGAYGQLMVVIPEQQAVIAITCQTSDMQAELNMVWDYLLPAIKDNALPDNPAAQAELKRRLASLTLPMAAGNSDSPAARRISGKKFRIAENEKRFRGVSFNFDRSVCKFTLTDDKAEYPVRCGIGKWEDGICNVPGTPPKLSVGNLLPCKVAASAAWKDDNTLEMLWRYYETPHHDTVTCQFNDDGVTVQFMNSLGHGETRPKLRGQA